MLSLCYHIQPTKHQTRTSLQTVVIGRAFSPLGRR